MGYWSTMLSMVGDVSCALVWFSHIKFSKIPELKV